MRSPKRVVLWKLKASLSSASEKLPSELWIMEVTTGREVLRGGGTSDTVPIPFPLSSSFLLPSSLPKAEAWQVMGRHYLDDWSAPGWSCLFLPDGNFCLQQYCAWQLCPLGQGKAAVSHGGFNSFSSPKQKHNSPDCHGEFNPLVWYWHRLEFQGLWLSYLLWGLNTVCSILT